MAAHKGPLGDLPGMTFDPVRNRYFPTREEEERPVATPPEPNSLRAGFRERLKRGRQAGRTTQAEVSGRGDVGKVESRVVKARNPRSKAATPSRGDRKNTSSHLDPDVRRIDKTLLRTTGLDLGRYDRFPLPTHAESQKRRQRERSSLYSRMTSVTPYDEPTLPSALTVMSVLPDQPTSILLGDSMGSIHAVKMEYDLPEWDFDADIRQTSAKVVPRHRRWLWQEINLGKRITGIRATNEHYMYILASPFSVHLLPRTHAVFLVHSATTFGPRPRIVVSQLPAMLSAFEGTSAQPSFLLEEEKPTVLWELTKVQDAWSMDSVGTAVIVGGNHQIVYAQDIVDPVFRSIRTPGDSDALSVCQLDINQAIVGLRSSAILHYDFRLPDASAATTRLDLGKSVCGLKYLNMGGGAGGRTLIASGYTNQLALFDLRFPKAGPIQRYHEHVNDYRSGLGLAVDPSGTHVFAAGSDQRIRAWSIMNGQLVPDTRRQAGGQGQRRLLGDPYSALINGIEVSEDNRIHILNDRQLETYIQY